MSHKYYLKSLKDVTDFTYEYSWKFSRPNHEVNCENFVVNEIKLDLLHTKVIFTSVDLKWLIIDSAFVPSPEAKMAMFI